ncbi:hypothetical protein OQH61_01155 [Helicobacter sp. MIT 21-1697]|uniref:hypothetical protein n=1 Tax=Helicobacter sp. MIT 21-1697 TaxID=2993733 RepID=UPI00224A87AA|nr:hypothetical protein [Helicobacter sp. MIT 21-1697]MCX2716348.1 hypothetical protein [Helicobacter sp. MIT 21-1697]
MTEKRYPKYEEPRKWKELNTDEKAQVKRNWIRDILTGFAILLICFVMAIDYEFNRKCIVQNGVTMCKKK